MNRQNEFVVENCFRALAFSFENATIPNSPPTHNLLNGQWFTLPLPVKDQFEAFPPSPPPPPCIDFFIQMNTLLHTPNGPLFPAAIVAR